MSEKKWRILPQDSALVSILEKQAGIPPVVAQLLTSRGVTCPNEVKAFLDAKLASLRDPEDLPGLTSAADHIFAAIQRNDRIIIYGDYDADGMTATAILFRCLQILNANVGYYVPNRMDEGYGLNSDAVRKLAKDGTKLIISVDCGIASLREADVAKEVGVSLVITDHHELADSLPDTPYIVHPRLPGHDYPFAGLCGAGVAFKLAWALCQRSSDAKKVSPRLRNFLMLALGLAAMGTVADVVPLHDENRVIVRHGLLSLQAYPCAGLTELMKLTKLDRKTQLSSEDIGFVLGPRLNAAGRLGQAQLGVELLTTDSEERAKALAEYINELNNSRTSLERSIYLAASKQVKENFDPESEPALVLAGRGWHQGVIGIVAGRLAERFYRPVVVISLDEFDQKPGVGSARSVQGVNLHEALAACTEHLVTHGGHAAAAGLRIDAAHVETFRNHFCDHVAERFKPDQRIAEVLIDAEAALSQLTFRTVQQLEMLAPFGEGNRRPILCCHDVEITVPAKSLGAGERHVSVTFGQHGVQLRAVAFNKPEWIGALGAATGKLDIAFQPVLNEFRGMRSVQLQLVDWRPAKRSDNLNHSANISECRG
ncbi:MAG: single-stranded-DNA-specific exonuclease RecJ [Planctomycetales bacterium]|nr:single-stranded-DNA-specific exonuclease RecJ [Planctomycetales bacterium]